MSEQPTMEDLCRFEAYTNRLNALARIIDATRRDEGTHYVERERLRMTAIEECVRIIKDASAPPHDDAEAQG